MEATTPLTFSSHSLRSHLLCYKSIEIASDLWHHPPNSKHIHPQHSAGSLLCMFEKNPYKGPKKKNE